MLWEFACLPFGLASAPRTFTKLFKPVVAQLKKRGIRKIILADILRNSELTDVAMNHVSILGFVVNKVKFVCKPTKEQEFLGFLVNSETMSLYLPKDKKKGIKRDCQEALDNPTLSIRVLSCLLVKR